MEFFLDNKPYWFGIQVYMREQQPSGRWGYVEPLTIKVPEEESLSQPPTFELENQEAQSLMDQLWHCGLRPSEGTGSAGALKATQEHLADMRKLAFAAILEGNDDE
jgi:hypothetical protein